MASDHQIVNFLLNVPQRHHIIAIKIFSTHEFVSSRWASSLHRMRQWEEIPAALSAWYKTDVVSFLWRQWWVQKSVNRLIPQSENESFWNLDLLLRDASRLYYVKLVYETVLDAFIARTTHWKSVISATFKYLDVSHNSANKEKFWLDHKLAHILPRFQLYFLVIDLKTTRLLMQR